MLAFLHVIFLAEDPVYRGVTEMSIDQKGNVFPQPGPQIKQSDVFFLYRVEKFAELLVLKIFILP